MLRSRYAPSSPSCKCGRKKFDLGKLRVFSANGGHSNRYYLISLEAVGLFFGRIHAMRCSRKTLAQNRQPYSYNHRMVFNCVLTGVRIVEKIHIIREWHDWRTGVRYRAIFSTIGQRRWSYTREWRTVRADALWGNYIHWRLANYNTNAN